MINLFSGIVYLPRSVSIFEAISFSFSRSFSLFVKCMMPLLVLFSMQAHAMDKNVKQLVFQNAYQQDTGHSGFAEKAIDGITNGHYWSGSVTHTRTSNSWWAGDLGSQQSISQIKIYNRTDCCKNRLNQFRIIITKYPLIDPQRKLSLDTIKYFSKKYPGTYLSEPLPYFLGSYFTYDITEYSGSVDGRYVYIWEPDNVLHLAEVQAYYISKSKPKSKSKSKSNSKSKSKSYKPVYSKFVQYPTSDVIVTRPGNITRKNRSISDAIDVDGYVNAVHIESDWWNKRPTYIKVYEKSWNGSKGRKLASEKISKRDTKICGDQNRAINGDVRSFLKSYKRECKYRPNTRHHAPSSLLTIPVGEYVKEGIIVEIKGSLSGSGTALIKRLIVDID